MKRRTFLDHSGKVALASLLAIQCKTKEIAYTAGLDNIGIQLYTVRDDMSSDPLGTLRTISEIGFDHVESAGYDARKFYGMTPKEFKIVISDLGMNMYTGHTRSGTIEPEVTYCMRRNWEAVCEDAAAAGQKYLICGWLHPDERQTLDQYKETADLFNKCGEVSNKYGIKTGFHNHDFEFEVIDDQLPYDILLSRTDADKVCFELDHYWTRKAGIDGTKLMSDHSGRFPLWHIKDMEDSEEQFFTEVGNGVIDWKDLFNSKDDSGMEFFFVEQDTCRNHKPLKSAEIGHDYLSKLKV